MFSSTNIDVALALFRIFRCRIIAPILVLCCSTISANTELPLLGEHAVINIEREKIIGESVYKRLLDRGLIETHPLLDRYINDLGARLLAGIGNWVREYKFFIVRDDSVNAFALPGGYIGINIGLIRKAESQHQLASVLAHEVAHVRLMHGLDLMKKGGEANNAALLTVLAGLLLGGVDSEVGAAVVFGGLAGNQQSLVNFTRENEYEADRLGIELLQGAQFDPQGMVEFFQIMTNLSVSSELNSVEYLRTHPVGVNRIAGAMSRVRDMQISNIGSGEFQLFKDFLQYVSIDHLQIQGSTYLKALAYIQAGENKQANDLLTELYEGDSENIWYSIAFAENLEQLGQKSEAELVYRRLLDIFPGDYILSLRLIRLLKQERRSQSALIIARNLEIRYPGEKQVYFELSEIYQSLNKPALRLMAEAEFHRLTGNSKQAIRLYDELLRLEGVDLATESKAREKRLLLLEK